MALHESYSPCNELELTLASGEHVVLGGVFEAGKGAPMIYIFSTRMPDGSYVAFDVRQIPELVDAFAGVSIASRARMAALASAIRKHFERRDVFYAALVGAGSRMASRPPTAHH